MKTRRYYKGYLDNRRRKVVVRYQKCNKEQCTICRRIAMVPFTELPSPILNLVSANHKRHLATGKHWVELDGKVYVEVKKYHWKLESSWVARKV